MPLKIESAKAQRDADEARAKARASMLAFREDMLNDQLEGKSLTAARRAEFARLRAAAPQR